MANELEENVRKSDLQTIAFRKELWKELWVEHRGKLLELFARIIGTMLIDELDNLLALSCVLGITSDRAGLEAEMLAGRIHIGSSGLWEIVDRTADRKRKHFASISYP